MNQPRTPPTPIGTNDCLDDITPTKMPQRRFNQFHRRVRDFWIVQGKPTVATRHTMLSMLEWMEALLPHDFERFAKTVLAKREADDAHRHRRKRGLYNECRDLGR